MIKEFLIFLFVFGFLLKIFPEILSLSVAGASLTSPTPQPTPAPEPTTLPSTDVWQLTIAGLAVVIAGGLMIAFVFKKSDKSSKRKEG